MSDWGEPLDVFAGGPDDDELADWEELDPATAQRLEQEWAAREVELFGAPLAKFNTRHDRLGRFASSGGTRAPVTAPGAPPAPIGGQDTADFVRHATRTQGGFTVARTTGKGPTSGYCVAIKPKRGLVLDPGELGNAPAKVRAWVKANEDEFAQPDTYMGGWLDKANRKVALDIVRVYPANREGRRKAIKVGKDNDQVAIFSLHEGKEIPTGGTGGYVGKADGVPLIRLLTPDSTDAAIRAWLAEIAGEDSTDA
jgi:hypothetical protein